MIPGLSKSRSPIGIELAGRRIYAVQLARSGSDWSVEAAASVARSLPDGSIDRAETQRVADVLDRQGFQGRDVVIGLPGTKLMTSLIELPPRESAAPRLDISRAELAAAHKCDPHSIEVAFWDRPDPARKMLGTSAIVVGCRTADANEILDAFEASRFTVRALDVPSCALARALHPLLAQTATLAAVVTIDWSGAHLVVFFGTVVVYERSLAESGLDRLHDMLGDRLGLDADVAEYLLREIGLENRAEDDQQQQALIEAARECILEYAERLASEMRLSLAYVTQAYGRPQVDRLVVLGEAARIPKLADRLAGLCSVSASVLTPAKLARGHRSSGVRCDAPDLTTAYGLALYPTGGRR
jgi:type IV pilus assembly protein PilM